MWIAKKRFNSEKNKYYLKKKITFIVGDRK